VFVDARHRRSEYRAASVFLSNLPFVAILKETHTNVVEASARPLDRHGNRVSSGEIETPDKGIQGMPTLQSQEGKMRCRSDWFAVHSL